MIILGIPVLNRPEITNECIDFLAKSVQSEDDFHLVVIDNASDEPYVLPDDLPFSASVIRNEDNKGFYYPILQLQARWANAEIIAIMHNDVFVYEYGWDERLRFFFEDDPKLGVVGFCGSDEVDIMGGRGGGTMCNFNGSRGQLQEHTGKRIRDLRPALILDSMFMAFRKGVIPKLDIPEEVPPAHFWDKILPMRAVEADYRVAVLGIDIDHLGGTTLVAEPRFEGDMRLWCEKWGLEPGQNAGMAVYLEAERQWLTEYRDQKNLMPIKVNSDYSIYRV